MIEAVGQVQPAQTQNCSIVCGWLFLMSIIAGINKRGLKMIKNKINTDDLKDVIDLVGKTVADERKMFIEILRELESEVKCRVPMGSNTYSVELLFESVREKLKS